jgi:hypothetical protein
LLIWVPTPTPDPAIRSPATAAAIRPCMDR